MSPIEEKFYEIAGEELFSKNVNKGCWARSFSLAVGDEAKTKAIYIELRVKQLFEQYSQALTNEREKLLSEEKRIKRLLSKFEDVGYKDIDSISNELFVASKNSGIDPIAVSRGVLVVDMLEFQIVDLIKRGLIKGVYDNKEWYFELE